MYWLLKTEPDQFSYDDLVAAKESTDTWDGIRNYQARNFMRDQMRRGHQVFIYHSRIAEPGIVGTAEIVREAYPDPSALDSASKYFDPKSDAKGISRWCMVDVKAVEKFRRIVTLAELRQVSSLAEMPLLQKGQRLSIQPVAAKEWRTIIKLASK